MSGANNYVQWGITGFFMVCCQNLYGHLHTCSDFVCRTSGNGLQTQRGKPSNAVEYSKILEDPRSHISVHRKQPSQQTKDPGSKRERMRSDEQLIDQRPSGEQLRDRRTSDKQLRDQRPSGEQLRDRRTSAEQLRDQRQSGEQLRDRRTSDKQLRDQRPSGEQLRDRRTSGEQLRDRRTSDEQLRDQITSDEQLRDRRTSSEQLRNRRTSDEQLRDQRTSDEQLRDRRTSSEQLRNRRTSDEQLRTSDERLRNRRTSDEQLRDQRTSDEQLRDIRIGTKRKQLNQLVAGFEPVKKAMNTSEESVHPHASVGESSASLPTSWSRSEPLTPDDDNDYRWPDDSQVIDTASSPHHELDYSRNFAPPPTHIPPHGGKRKRTAHASTDEIKIFRQLAPTFRQSKMTITKL